MATNDTYNFYDQSRLVRIDHVDNFNEFINITQNQASQDDVCEADFGEVVEENSDTDDKSKEEVAKVTVIPQELSTPQGIGWLHKMQDAGVLDENYQPDHLSWTKKGYLAYQIAFKLGITRVWKIMGGFWHLDSHSLKTGRDKAESTLKIQTFEEKIKPIFG